MKELRWDDPTIDKASWGDGPWLNEPDKMQWQDPDTGLPCLINRGPLGALCGYVGVSADHPWFEQDSDDCDLGNLDVHGGVNFTSHCLPDPEDGSLTICHVVEDGEDDNVWWIGFDCGHFNDLVPAFEHRMRELDIRHSREPDEFPELFRKTYKPIEYVKKEVTKLAMQLHAYAQGELPHESTHQ